MLLFIKILIGVGLTLLCMALLIFSTFLLISGIRILFIPDTLYKAIQRNLHDEYVMDCYMAYLLVQLDCNELYIKVSQRISEHG